MGSVVKQGIYAIQHDNSFGGLSGSGCEDMCKQHSRIYGKMQIFGNRKRGKVDL